MKSLLIAIGIIFIIAAIPVGAYVANANYGNRSEVLLKETWSNNQNILAQYGQKIAEITQVPDMYRDDVAKVTTAAIEGRYGRDGSKAVFLAIKEQNPNLDSKMYIKIQEAIESGRNDFQSAQTRLIDIRRQYETALGNVWSGFWLKLAGYPKVDLATNYQPISTERAQSVFKTGTEQPIKLR